MSIKMSIDFQLLLNDVESLPLLEIEELLADKKETRVSQPSFLVVAPHPDDETLGCGGAIALLRQLDLPVSVLVISDGTRSHPNSCKYAAPALKNLREQETLAALTILCVEVEAITFFGLPDCGIPTPEDTQYQDEIALCRDYLTCLAPTTIFLPWRGDRHRDHRAAWQLICDASQDLSDSPRLIEYPIWSENLQKPDRIDESVKAWRLDISNVVAQKQQAIAQYRSQTTNLIDDDPEGFCLAPEMLEKFARPWEVYLEI
jgi:LmbE family N-acetylglucosaminyl deacetylase